MRANLQTETGPLPVEVALVDQNSRPRRVRLGRVRGHPVPRRPPSKERDRRQEADMARVVDIHRHDAPAHPVGDHSAPDPLHAARAPEAHHPDFVDGPDLLVERLAGDNPAGVRDLHGHVEGVLRGVCDLQLYDLLVELSQLGDCSERGLGSKTTGMSFTSANQLTRIISA